MNQSWDEVRATKQYRPEGDLGEAKKKHLPPTVSRCPPKGVVHRCRCVADAVAKSSDDAALTRSINKPILGRIYMLWLQPSWALRGSTLASSCLQYLHSEYFYRLHSPCAKHLSSSE